MIINVCNAHISCILLLRRGQVHIVQKAIYTIGYTEDTAMDPKMCPSLNVCWYVSYHKIKV